MLLIYSNPFRVLIWTVNCTQVKFQIHLLDRIKIAFVRINYPQFRCNNWKHNKGSIWLLSLFTKNNKCVRALPVKNWNLFSSIPMVFLLNTGNCVYLLPKVPVKSLSWRFLSPNFPPCLCLELMFLVEGIFVKTVVFSISKDICFPV